MLRYEPKDDQEYIGNIWGWKFSLFGLLLILALVLAAVYVANDRGVDLLDGKELMHETDKSI